jgi:DNA-binding transcriptional LysR family regulator
MFSICELDAPLMRATRADMNLSDLEIFKTVAEEGAARKLHRVQSNVTTRIKRLEMSVGAELFFRDRQRLVLSPRG